MCRARRRRPFDAAPPVVARRGGTSLRNLLARAVDGKAQEEDVDAQVPRGKGTEGADTLYLPEETQVEKRAARRRVILPRNTTDYHEPP